MAFCDLFKSVLFAIIVIIRLMFSRIFDGMFEEVTNFLAVSLCIRNILAFLLKFKAERILRLIVAFDDVDDLMPLLVLLILHDVFASSQNVDKNLGLDALDAKCELACFTSPSLHFVVCF